MNRFIIRSVLLLALLAIIFVDAKVDNKKGSAKSQKKTIQSPEELDKLGQLKLEKMEKLKNKHSDGIIRFDPDTYNELVIKNPRPYDVVMMYTVG